MLHWEGPRTDRNNKDEDTSLNLSNKINLQIYACLNAFKSLWHDRYGERWTVVEVT